MVERNESTADHSDIHKVPKVPHESSWVKHKTQIHHLEEQNLGLISFDQENIDITVSN